MKSFKSGGLEDISTKTALIACVIMMSNTASADVNLYYPQQAECKSTVSAMQISGSRMRFDSMMENKKYSTLFDGLEAVITMLDHDERQYHQTEVDEDALDYTRDVMSSTGIFMDKQMKTVEAQMKQQCDQIEKQGMHCPDMSSMMQSAQAMMGQSIPSIEIKHSDKVQTIAGMACKTVERRENGIKVSEECYVEAKALSIPEKDRKYLLSNMKVMLHYSDSFSGLTKKFIKPVADGASLPDPANKDILLAKTCLAPDGSEAGRIEVQISAAVVEESRFAIPADYQMMDMIQ